MAELDWDALLDATSQYIDQDERYWDADQGAFLWDWFRVYFVKLPDEILVTVQGETRSCGRP